VALDYPAIISEESARIVDAYEHDPTTPIPWSDRWTVRTVARHVAGTHHVVGDIIRGRPDADFGLFNELQMPAKDSAAFPDWFRSGTRSLLEQLRSVTSADKCWSWYATDSTVGWWARRMAHEAVVHRCDTDTAQLRNFSIDSEVAADGVDEYLDVFVASTRATHNAPSGPTVEFRCSDRNDRWWLALSDRGQRNVSRGPGDASVHVSAPAQQLLLMLWGRVPWSNRGEVAISGDAELLKRWSEFVPPM
jgi:uncharacterized protein (TIGR03083 family)